MLALGIHSPRPGNGLSQRLHHAVRTLALLLCSSQLYPLPDGGSVLSSVFWVFTMQEDLLRWCSQEGKSAGEESLSATSPRFSSAQLVLCTFLYWLLRPDGEAVLTDLSLSAPILEADNRISILWAHGQVEVWRRYQTTTKDLWLKERRANVGKPQTANIHFNGAVSTLLCYKYGAHIGDTYIYIFFHTWRQALHECHVHSCGCFPASSYNNWHIQCANLRCAMCELNTLRHCKIIAAMC